MKTVFENTLTFILLVVISLSAALIIGVNLEISTARKFYANVVDRIQASYYSSSVIAECITNANAEGYSLTVQDMSVFEDKKDMLVTMHYSTSVPLFGIVKEGVIEGYAK